MGRKRNRDARVIAGMTKKEKALLFKLIQDYKRRIIINKIQSENTAVPINTVDKYDENGYTFL